MTHRGKQAREESRGVIALAFVTGMTGTILIAAFSGPLQVFYGEVETQAVAAALSSIVVLSAVEGIVAAVLKTELRFRTFAICQIAGEVTALVVGVVMAMAGAGVWALVISSIGARLVSLVAMLAVARLRLPVLRGTMALWGRAARYGGLIAASGAAYTIAMQGDNVLIGRLLGVTALGLYAFAYNYGTVLGGTIGAIVGHVAFPIFSLSKDSPEALRLHFMRFTRLSSIVAAPLAAVAVAFAHPAIEIILGPEWRDAIPPLQILLIMGIVWEFFPEKELLRSLGKVGVEFKVGIVAAPLVLISTVVGSNFGLTGVAVLVSLVFFASAVVQVAACAPALRMKRSSVLFIPVPFAVAAALTTFIAWLLTRPLSLEGQLLVGIPAALVLYGLVATRFLRAAWRDLLTLARPKSSQRIPPELLES